MNKFVKLPLFLGSIALVFCSTLAVVVSICQPVIAYNTRMKQFDAYANLYEGVDKAKINDAIEIDASYDRINTIAYVPHNDLASYVYTVTTKDPQSGTLQFMIGLEKLTGNIDAYFMLNNNNSGYATYFNNNEVVLNDLSDKKVQAVGVKETLSTNVVQAAIDQAIAHFDANFKGGN